jgi:hypothetical protein
MLIGDRNLGSEIVRQTVATLSVGMRRMPNICPKCDEEVFPNDFSNKVGRCPNHGQLEDPGDMVIAIESFSRAFPHK